MTHMVRPEASMNKLILHKNPYYNCFDVRWLCVHMQMQEWMVFSWSNCAALLPKQDAFYVRKEKHSKEHTTTDGEVEKAIPELLSANTERARPMTRIQIFWSYEYKCRIVINPDEPVPINVLSCNDSETACKWL